MFVTVLVERVLIETLCNSDGRDSCNSDGTDSVLNTGGRDSVVTVMVETVL